MIKNISSINATTPLNQVKPVAHMTEGTIDTVKEIPAPSSTNTSEKHFTESDLKDIVQGMNDFLTPTRTGLKFEYHQELKEYYVTLVNEDTKEVVREIPSKKVLDFYAAMTERIGWLIDEKI